MLSAADIEEDRRTNAAFAAAGVELEAQAKANFLAVQETIRTMAEPHAIYIAKAERTGPINFDSLCAVVDAAAAAESERLGTKIEVTNSEPFSGEGGVTVYLMQTYHPSIVACACARKAGREHLQRGPTESGRHRLGGAYPP